MRARNARVKGKGRVIGSPAALRRWTICGTELVNYLDEFENTIFEEEFATQIKMKQQVQSLVEVISAFANPFEDDRPEHLVLNSQDCVDESVISTMWSIEYLGKLQYLN